MPPITSVTSPASLAISSGIADVVCKVFRPPAKIADLAANILSKFAASEAGQTNVGPAPPAPRATALPMPREPPVTKAVLPSKPKSGNGVRCSTSSVATADM